MKADKLFNECLADVPNDIAIEIDLSFDIADRISSILSSRNISQKEFAEMMGKKESEVSKWLKGTHNFTLRTIAKITDALNEPLVEVAGKRVPDNEFVFIKMMDSSDSFTIPKKSESVTVRNRPDYIPVAWNNRSFCTTSKMMIN